MQLFLPIWSLHSLKKIPSSIRTHKSFLPDRLHNSFFLESTTQSEIVETANSLRLNTAAGHDKIPMWSVKESINYISEPLTYVLNISINSGLLPAQLKLARVVPLDKSGDKSLLSNYRPLSVLPVFSKFLEKVVYNRLIRFFDKYEILYNNQYGFRKKHSTSLALLYLRDKITSAIDDRKHTIGIFLIYLKLLIPLIIVIYSISSSTLGFVVWP